MEEFKKLLEEDKYNNLDETEDDTFSTLLDEIEIRANFHTSFKLTRTNSKILRQELQSLQQEYEEQKLKDSLLESKQKELLSLLEEKKSYCEIEIAKKRLNALKHLVKLKWMKSPPNYLEGLVFNENNAYVKYFSYEITDSSIPSKLRNEISTAANSQNSYSKVHFL